MSEKTHSIDMCNGPLFLKIVRFCIPVMLSNMLQLVYNAADQIIVGRFAGNTSLAAVGSTASLINLLLCALMGLTVGTSSVIARHFGANNENSLSRAVHTSMTLSIVCGIVVGISGIIFCHPILKLMNTPSNVLRLSTLYMQIYFAGIPFVAVFNFGAAILRAVGDTKRPMIYLVISGLINVVLNIIFVAVFKMDVVGVATATVISQIIAAILTLKCLILTDERYKLNLRELKCYKTELMQIIQVGLPASIQSTSFSISNVFIQSAINSFGEAAMAGCTAAANIDTLIYQAMNALYHTVLSFAGQNYGAQKKDRIVKSVLYCSGIVTVVGLILGTFCHLFGSNLLSFFAEGDEAISYGVERLKITCIPYFICGLMEVAAGGLRGINKSAISMAGSIVGACVLRIVWIYTIFAMSPSILTLFISYPVTWAMTAIFHYTMFFIFIKKMKNIPETA